MRTINVKFSVLLVLALLLSIVSVQAQEISPYLFGQNHWMDRGDEGSRPGYLYMLWPKVEEAGIKMVRIGGNGYENRFPDRPTLTAMIDSIRAIGAEPFLQVPRKFTEKQVTDLVNDFKFQNGKGIRFYSIGNEPLLQNRSTIPEVYAYIKRLAPAMKAADPSIKIFVFDEAYLHREGYDAMLGGEFDLTGKDENGHWMVDGITFHSYPNGAEFTRDNVVFSGPNGIRRDTQRLLELISKANEKHGRTGNEKLLWGLTEVNVTYVNPNREIAGIGNPSFLGGQFIAEIYGIGLEFGAFSVDPWCLVETDRVRTDFGFLGLPTDFYPRSSYYHTQMMATHMKGAFLPSSSNNSYVKSIATMSDSEIVIMIMNKDQVKDFEFNLVLQKDGLTQKPLLIQADAGIDKVISGSIPNQTTLMLVLSKDGVVKKKYTYGLSHNLRHLPPQVE